MCTWLKRKQVLVLVVAMCVLGSGIGRAIVIAPTFDELVEQAETIFFGEVVDRNSRWVERSGGKVIATSVTFRVLQTLKGPETGRTQLEFQGGTVGDVTLNIEDVPQFDVGDRDILFVNTSEPSPSPIVGMIHGRFRIIRDAATGRDVVRRYDGSALRSIADIGQAQATQFRPEMTIADFVGEIRKKVAQLKPRP